MLVQAVFLASSQTSGSHDTEGPLPPLKVWEVWRDEMLAEKERWVGGATPLMICGVVLFFAPESDYTTELSTSKLPCMASYHKKQCCALWNNWPRKKKKKSKRKLGVNIYSLNSKKHEVYINLTTNNKYLCQLTYIN